jgi:hypothetical protein
MCPHYIPLYKLFIEPKKRKKEELMKMPHLISLAIEPKNYQVYALAVHSGYDIIPTRKGVL